MTTDTTTDPRGRTAMTSTTKMATMRDNPYYSTHKHAFKAMPNDSVTCRWCDRSFVHDLHANIPQPLEHDAGLRDQASHVIPKPAIIDENGVLTWEEPSAQSDTEQPRRGTGEKGTPRPWKYGHYSGKYRPEAATPTYRPSGKIASWNKKVKRLFPSCAEFHAAAQAQISDRSEESK